MPDTYDNVGTAATEQPPGFEVQLKINHGDPDLAVTSRVAIPGQSNSVQQSQPMQPPNQAAPAQPFAIPTLRDNSALFNVPDSRVPATEYVSINTTPIPRPVPRATPPPVERPVFTQPMVMSGQAIGPIIRKRPAVDRPQKVVEPLSIPASVAMVAQGPPQMAPAPMVVQRPVMPQQQTRSVRAQPEQNSTPPQPGSTIASEGGVPVEAPVDPSAPAVTIGGMVMGAAPNYDKTITAFSQNTRAVWHARRSGKTLSIAFACGLALVLIGVYMYWKSIGSPTNVQDIPILHLH